VKRWIIVSGEPGGFSYGRAASGTVSVIGRLQDVERSRQDVNPAVHGPLVTALSGRRDN